MRSTVEVRWWPIVISVGAAIISALLAVVLVIGVRTDSRRTTCALIVSSDEGYREVPPVQPAGKLQARKIRELRASQGCPPHEEE